MFAIKTKEKSGEGDIVFGVPVRQSGLEVDHIEPCQSFGRGYRQLLLKKQKKIQPKLNKIKLRSFWIWLSVDGSAAVAAPLTEALHYSTDLLKTVAGLKAIMFSYIIYSLQQSSQKPRGYSF